MVRARGTRHGRSGSGKKQNAEALPIQRQQSTTEKVEQLLSLRIRLQRLLLKAGAGDSLVANLLTLLAGC